jgi:putative ABC transport system permease protein
MKKSLIKNTLREIKNSKARFFSIMAIIALGCGFYCGIRATAPSMVNMANSYYQRTSLMDYRLVSTVGFDDDDVKAVESVDGVTAVDAGYFADIVSDYSDSAHEVRLIAVTDKLNELTVLEGRLPQKKGEVVIEDGSFSGGDLKVGDTINVEKNAGDTDVSEMLTTLKFKVVGVVRSPLYISYERGSTTVGDGSLDTFMYVDKSSFDSERYTELYVKTKYSDGETMTDEYLDNIDSFTSKLKKVGKTQSKIFKTDTIDDAQKTLDEKKQEYEDSKKKAEKKLSDAKSDLEEAEETYNTKIADAQAEITSAESKLQKGYADYNSAKEKYNEEIKKAEQKLSKAKKDYKKGEKEYKAGLKKYNQGKKKYDQAYVEFYEETKPELETQLETAKTSLKTLEDGIAKIDEQLSTLTNQVMVSALETQKSQLESQKEELEDGITKLENGLKTGESKLSKSEKTLKTSKAKLDKSKQKLESAKEEISKGEAKLKTSKTQGKAKLDKAYNKLKSSESKLAQAKTQLEESKTSGLQKINDGKKEYEKSKAKAEKKLAKAEKKLNKAQKKIDDIASPKWYVFDREDNPGYSTFSDNTDRVDAVAGVFPVFFLLVAVLVCLTTMTRLVDEKRTEIGTLKALGYSNSAIVAKFLVYSTTAGIIGSGIGIVIGINTLPYFIYNAYKMMYNMDAITIIADPVSIVLNVVIAVICTTFVTAFACYKSLNKRPAKLMRPKGPKTGKRILLERITPVWKRFGFTSKVTARNIFRYKSRMFMTVLGVAGCTALIVAAFGMKDSLSAIASVQFDEIYTYNAIVVADGGTSAEKVSELNSDIADCSQVNSSAVVAFVNGKVKSNSEEISDDVSISVPENLDDYKKIVNLRTRTNHKAISLNDDGVVITEKMSQLLNVKKGDTITLTVDDVEKNFKISSVCEQYVGHYVYMTPAIYEKCYGSPDYSTVFVKLDNDEAKQSDFGKEMLERDDVSAITFIQSKIDEFNDMLNSMNMIVFIMILCAGALAFVVLYNLTNINIAERVREIATIKVLGFNNRETSSFIYRENIVLVVMGIIIGLIMGTFLSSWIVSTVELDTVMFGRTIRILSYVLATLLTVLFALVVNFIMYFKMKKIDMIESLKSVE